MEFWQTKLPEQEQLDEQNPSKEPELAGQLDVTKKNKMEIGTNFKSKQRIITCISSFDMPTHQYKCTMMNKNLQKI